MSGLSGLRATTSVLATGTSSSPGDRVGADLAETVGEVLLATLQALDLLTLELRVPGRPELATLVRRPEATPSGTAPSLQVWSAAVAPGAWHPGVLLVAVAAEGGAGRRAVVQSTARLLAELLSSDGRRREAEGRAVRAQEDAGIDPLTGIGNRRSWQRAVDDEAARLRRYGGCSSVIVLDLDGLKEINDQQGHSAGDALLRRAAVCLGQVARTVDAVCRLGGDEFGVLAPDTSADGAHRLASRLRAALLRADVAASIGVATCSDGDLDGAWRAADVAMYDVKRAAPRQDPAAEQGPETT